MKLTLLLLTAVSLCTGCASVMNDVTHPVKLETKSEAGVLVSDAECVLTNDKASVILKSGGTSNVRRSSKDLDIVCRHGAYPDAAARAVFRMNGAVFGNIILGGAIGALVDHSRGTAYTYPTWVQLVFGRSLVFDRRSEKDGETTHASGLTATMPAQPGAPKPQ